MGVTVVVPFFNEEEGIMTFCTRIDQYVSKVTFPVELVFVNDGSTDRTVNVIENFDFREVDSVKVISFTRNYGSQAAIRAGILHSKYDICTWISVDLQEPLDLISLSYNEIMENKVNIVYIEKDEIDVNPISRFFSKQYNYLMRRYAIKDYPSGGIGALVFDRKVKDFLNGNVEINSAIVLQLLNSGFRNKIFSLKFNAREMGHSKWTFSKKLKILIDSFVSFSYMPIRMVSSIGIAIFFIGLLIALLTLINKFIHPNVPVGYSTIVGVVTMGFGVTNISLGIIAEYLWRTFDVSRHQVPFIISEEIVIKEYEEKNH